jgi:regulator of sigma E protease
MLLSVIIFIITLLILVVIHEFGHFLTAKKFGIKVEEFGFGIPPRAWGKKVGETLVSINWLPFGGFVRLLGEEESAPGKISEKEKQRYFSARPVGQRIVVVVAGVVMNLLMAWVLFYITLGFSGFQTDIPLIAPHQFVGVTQKDQSQVVIRQVVPNSPAGQAGLKLGDQVVAVNDLPITSAQELINKTKVAVGQPMRLTVKDLGNKTHAVELTPRVNPPAGEGPLGVALDSYQFATITYQTPVQKLLAGPVHSYNVIAYSAEILGRFINQSIQQKSFKPVSQTVSGPVGITSVANSILTSTDNPVLPYLNFVAVLSLNLAVMNVLPFPALDGGRLFFLLIEAVTRKKVNEEVERWVHSIGMAILLVLIMLVTFSDIKKFF